MKTVKEVSRITGVSVRTLHHYDAIGLLKPTAVTEAGYRLYDDAALERMQSILLFRELQFPLKDIKRILDAPDFDPMAALAQQVHLLEMQREHLEHSSFPTPGKFNKQECFLWTFPNLIPVRSKNTQRRPSRSGAKLRHGVCQPETLGSA